MGESYALHTLVLVLVVYEYAYTTLPYSAKVPASRLNVTILRNFRKLTAKNTTKLRNLP